MNNDKVFFSTGVASVRRSAFAHLGRRHYEPRSRGCPEGTRYVRVRAHLMGHTSHGHCVCRTVVADRRNGRSSWPCRPHGHTSI